MSPRSRLDRLVAGHVPRRARGLLAGLVLVTVAAALVLPAPVAAASGLLAVVLAGLWCGPLGRVGAALVVAAALVPLPAGLLPAELVPASLLGTDDLLSAPTAALAAAVAAAAVLAACAQLVAHCTTAVTAAHSSAVQATVARAEDVRAAQQSQQQLAGELHYWSTHDALTGVLNRSAFLRLVDATLAAGHSIGILVVSVSGFTRLNEQLGDRFGDGALTELAHRLGATARGGDVIARLGGDTFGVLLCGLQPQDAHAVGARVLQNLDEPVRVGEAEEVLRVRCGLAVGSPAQLEVPGSGGGRDLLRAAEAAARTATIGRPPTVVSSVAPPRAVDEGLTETDLARALDADELFLLYQPLVHCDTGRITAVEALVRWRHPVHGLVPPDAFIGLAERTGLILPLGLRVLGLACAQLAAWSPVAPELTVAVNVSARQLVEPGFVEEVRQVLWSSRVDPARVVLELTESLLVDDSEAAAAVLWQLRGLGVRLALDDFGTGYSSLGRLGDLPLDEMKIDKSFVDRLGALPRDSATLVTAAVAMGHGLGLEVVAEGVETPEQAAFLREVGCDLLQGYLLGRPQEPGDLTSQLGAVLLPPPPRPSSIPDPRPEHDRVVVPAVMPPSAPRLR